jgi:hypothetical protein
MKNLDRRIYLDFFVFYITTSLHMKTMAFKDERHYNVNTNKYLYKWQEFSMTVSVKMDNRKKNLTRISLQLITFLPF